MSGPTLAISGDVITGIKGALLGATSYSYTSGSTHHFYHYPARFAPKIAHAVIAAFSASGDWILDPFMGGGTTVIEGLPLGRRMIGVDINALAHFVASVRTRPLSEDDEDVIRTWADVAATELASHDVSWVQRTRVHNLPNVVSVFMAGALDLGVWMFPRQRAFARCALLRLGQWALDCRDFEAPRRKRLARRLPELVDEMLAGLREFTSLCQATGMGKRAIMRNRILIRRSAVGLELDPRVAGLRPALVFTSPPYPGVNVLYHRWQYRGRKETPAPYWIANVPDGYGQSFYTGGSRSPTGLRNYFAMITDVFRSVRQMVSDHAHVVQLVGFSDAATQLPQYLECMRLAGFLECDVGGRLGRKVPNRKWYAKLKGNGDASMEVLLIHRPA